MAIVTQTSQRSIRGGASPIASLLRYSMAIVGPVGSAAAQFLLSLVLLHALSQAQFGRFSFLLIASQLSWGVWSALICSPLPVLLVAKSDEEQLYWRRCLDATNLVGSTLAFFAFMAMGLLIGEGPSDAAIFAAYGAVSLLRWYARARAYAMGDALRTTASDILYSLALLIMVVMLGRSELNTLQLAWGALLVAAVIGMLPFGRTYLIGQFVRFSPRAIRHYPLVWRLHSRWSLFGVVTTEATANAHAYFVTLLLGPTAFAPVAASALIIRPINVAMNALTEFERAQLARLIGNGRTDLAAASLRFFHGALGAVWVATGIAIVILFLYFPRLVFPEHYSLHYLAVGAALWMAVSAMRLARTPDSALLQAAGAFQPLARASMYSSIVSVLVVLAIVVAGDPLWSIAGIFVGETLFAARTRKEAKRWLARPRSLQHMPAKGEDGPIEPQEASVVIGQQ